MMDSRFPLRLRLELQLGLTFYGLPRKRRGAVIRGTDDRARRRWIYLFCVVSLVSAGFAAVAGGVVILERTRVGDVFSVGTMALVPDPVDPVDGGVVELRVDEPPAELLRTDDPAGDDGLAVRGC